MTKIPMMKCDKCGEMVRTYLTINHMCYDCFFKMVREDNERRAERKRKQEERLGKKKNNNETL